MVKTHLLSVFLVSAFLSVETPGWEKRWGARHGKKELDELPYSKFLSFCGVYLLKNA